MTRTAYLVAHFDTSSGVPVFKGTAVYSENAQSLIDGTRLGRFACDVMEATGDDFEKAIHNLELKFKRERIDFGWAVPFGCPTFL